MKTSEGISTIGKIQDCRCKQNSIRPIGRCVCRNNCKYWKNKCLLGYNGNKKGK